MRLQQFTTIGSVYGNWIVIEAAVSSPSGKNWKVQCRCGSIRTIQQSGLHAGTSTSCGCGRRTHGKTNTVEYTIWAAMWQRCANPRNRQYGEYRNRAPDEAWRSFETFYADMGPRPSSKHSIERVENSKGYSKDNCIWALVEVQARNKTNNRWITIGEETKLLTEWLSLYKRSPAIFYRRLSKGWTAEAALVTQVNAHSGRPKGVKRRTKIEPICQ